jgi:copper resistance protein B
MSALRIVPPAAALVAIVTAAAAQMPPAKEQPAPGMQPGGAMPPVMDQTIFAHVIFNELEGRWNGSNTEFRWEGQGWVGTDYDKLWIKSEGTLSKGALDDGQQQFLYSRAITTYFDLQGGLRSDFDSRPTRNWAALGIQGLAPYFFDIEGTGFVSGQGHLAAKLEASYDLLLTQRLILQPQIEINLYSKADPVRMIGVGISDIDTGLRLRYEINRKFAPYLGVVYEGRFGQTANFARRAGESTGGVRFVAGLRLWF